MFAHLGRIREPLYAQGTVAVDGRRAGRARSVILVLLTGLVVVAGTGYLAANGSATPSAALQRASASFPGGPYFNVACGFSHRNNDDPILFPGEPGRSHNHTFIGNRHVDAATTPEALKDGDSSCGELDSSTYWVPTLFEGVDAQAPLAAVVYYTRHTSGPVASIPAGLKMVAGNANAKRPQPKGIVSWSCGGGASTKYAVVVACPEDSVLVFNLRFPNCWNGKTTDSADHKRHMAYSAKGACPESYPVRLPTITVLFLYAPTSKFARPASGKFGAHGDFMNGWDQSLLARLVSGLNY
jgi:Domain of unknown function (DUF1996)